jgi:hypothetical protein
MTRKFRRQEKEKHKYAFIEYKKGLSACGRKEICGRREKEKNF